MLGGDSRGNLSLEPSNILSKEGSSIKKRG
jgi:hypothetical protein